MKIPIKILVSFLLGVAITLGVVIAALAVQGTEKTSNTDKQQVSKYATALPEVRIEPRKATPEAVRQKYNASNGYYPIDLDHLCARYGAKEAWYGTDPNYIFTSDIQKKTRDASCMSYEGQGGGPGQFVVLEITFSHAMDWCADVYPGSVLVDTQTDFGAPDIGIENYMCKKPSSNKS